MYKTMEGKSGVNKIASPHILYIRRWRFWLFPASLILVNDFVGGGKKDFGISYKGCEAQEHSGIQNYPISLKICEPKFFGSLNPWMKSKITKKPCLRRGSYTNGRNDISSFVWEPTHFFYFRYQIQNLGEQHWSFVIWRQMHYKHEGIEGEGKEMRGRNVWYQKKSSSHNIIH